jgi:hypothetical protein
MRACCLLFATWALSSGIAVADTLMIIGVVVSPDGQRVAGADVRLYATLNQLGKPLAQDRTSERGIFNLYRTNIAGELGELYVVYEGNRGDAKPLNVTLKAAGDGRIEARTEDVVVLPAASASVTPTEAAERIAAVTETQAVLVKAGVMDQAKADATIAARTTNILTRLPPSSGAVSTVKHLTETNALKFGKEAGDMAGAKLRFQTAIKAIDLRAVIVKPS